MVRQETNTPFRTFYSENTFHGNSGLVCTLAGDPARPDWWGADIKRIQILSNENVTLIRHYFVYDAPCPITYRDLVARVKLPGKPATGTRTVFSKPLLNKVPEDPELLRVIDF